MFPFTELEQWLGADFDAGTPTILRSLSPSEAESLAHYIRERSMTPSALPRESQPGELRPHLATMRTLDLAWMGGSILDRLYAVLTYADSATAFDPLSFTIEEWVADDDKSGWDLRDILGVVADMLVQIHPLAKVGALELVPPCMTREFAEDLPPQGVLDQDLLNLLSGSGLSDRIGDFNTALGGAHSSARYRAYVHLFELRQDLILMSRYPRRQNPLFVAGFDADLARLLVGDPSQPAVSRIEALASFRFPVHQMTTARVLELRGMDEFVSWRAALQSALLDISISPENVFEAQSYVRLRMEPEAQRVMRAYNSHSLRDIVQVGLGSFVVGGVSGLAQVAVGADPAQTAVSGVTAAAGTAILAGIRARGRKHEFDVPFLSMAPEDPPEALEAIPKMGLL